MVKKIPNLGLVNLSIRSCGVQDAGLENCSYKWTSPWLSDPEMSENLPSVAYFTTLSASLAEEKK